MMNKRKLRRRNPLHNHPLLFKGSMHRRTYKSKRRKENVKLKKEWLPQSVFTKVHFGESCLCIPI